jgi:GalNAc-alpha-(1->4)-GalNAc-alpha-(1->3)-diNAcBac-PP-undecaprenol alpha-1,4-N-acetyl-D-galactosaminyltransferase
MKIVFLVSSLGAGGAERVATTLCNVWSESYQSVTLISTFSGGADSFYPLGKNVEIIHLATEAPRHPFGGKRYINRLLKLTNIINDRRPDLVISFLPNVNIANIICAATNRTPCIICERSDPLAQPIGFFWRMACKLLYRFADSVCVQTRAATTRIKTAYSGLKNVQSIPNPLPEDLLNWRAKYIQPKTKILLSIGRLADEKQVHLIIDAFHQLSPSHTDWQLHIYGDGPKKAALVAQVAALKLDHKVFILGKTTEPWRVMADADAFVMTSLYEGFPNALLEAMAVGLPCVATDCPSGPAEMTGGGSDALLVQPGDTDGLKNALDRLMSDPTLRQTLGERGRAAVLERYALNVVLKAWDDLFRQVGAKA